jgi:hypothetical protein
MKTQQTQLLSFLLWNRLMNNLFTKTKSQMKSYWLATIEAYQQSLMYIQTAWDNFTIPHPMINAPDPDIGELIVGVVGAFVVIVVGVNLVGPTATTVGGAIKSGNVTAIGGLVSILQVTVLIFGIIVLVAAVVFISVITNKAKAI